jgi:hypothetical protein
MPRSLFCWILSCVLFASAAAGQSPQADKIRERVGKIGVLGNATISLGGGTEYYGSISRIGADDFSLNEVDQKREIALRYADVKRVREGYGTTRNLYGRRIHPRTKWIVALAVIGGLLAFVFIAVASDKS